MVVDQTGADVHEKFGDSRSNRSRDVRVTHFVMDGERMTNDGGRKSRYKGDKKPTKWLFHAKLRATQLLEKHISIGRWQLTKIPGSFIFVRLLHFASCVVQRFATQHDYLPQLHHNVSRKTILMLSLSSAPKALRFGRAIVGIVHYNTI